MASFLNTGFLILFICMLCGFFLKQSKRLPESASRHLNTYVTNLALPAMVFVSLHKIFHQQELNHEIYFQASMAWFQFAIAGLLAWALSRSGVAKKTCGAVFLCVGLGNTSFVGFPLLEALVGRHALQTGVIVDQLGSFLVLSSLGVIVSQIFAEKTLSYLHILKRVLTYPPFIAFLLALIFCKMELPESLTQALDRIALTLSPVALVSVGLQLHFKTSIIKARSKLLSLALSFKLLLIPIFFLSLALLLQNLDFSQIHLLPETYRITILESAMATMINAAIIASDNDLDPELSSLMIGIGIPLSLGSVSLWAWILGF